MIVLDTNQLRFVLPGTPTLQLLSVVAERVGHTLATTDVVIREVVRQRRDELTDALNARIKADQNYDRLVVRPGSRSLNPIPIGWRNVSSFVASEVQEFESALRNTFLVLETRPEDALEALFREADHQPPCSKGRGGRDASILWTAARACSTPDVDKSGTLLPVFFVSEDKGFLAVDDSFSSATTLNTHVDGAGTLLLKATVIDLLAELGYTRQIVSAADIYEREDIRAGLLDAIIRTSANFVAPQETEALKAYEVNGPRLMDEKKAVQCHSDDVILTSLGGRWRMGAYFDPPEHDGRSGPQLMVGVMGMALVVETGDDVQVEFSPARRF